MPYGCRGIPQGSLLARFLPLALARAELIDPRGGGSSARIGRIAAWKEVDSPSLRRQKLGTATSPVLSVGGRAPAKRSPWAEANWPAKGQGPWSLPARPPLASSSAQSWSFTSGRGEALSSKAASCDTNPLKKGGTQEPRKKAEEWVLSWLPGFLLRVFLTTRLWR